MGNKGKIVLGIIIVYLIIALYTGSMNPLEWPWLSQAQNYAKIIVENIGKISGIGGGGISEAAIGVYWESTCTNEVSHIDWGILSPGETKTITVYVKNLASSAVTMTMRTQSWYPTEACNYITLTWDYNGQPIQPNAVIQIDLTLHVSPNIVGITNFSFDIVLSVTEA